ncbi:hypothetical protein BB558_002063 [Smittium angustum]|uniref:Uncharacterized protein n=1 Tax=Smittium angustum TaxID=133377 RepID=A0A2U1J9N6_SMIAN|nr:hypothetical protein BB558_006090 [Smittium angustum]PWA01822.1 hypothetical protein BB558_002063 [Smittium angustum]
MGQNLPPPQQIVSTSNNFNQMHNMQMQMNSDRKSIGGFDSIQRIASQPGVSSTNTHSPTNNPAPGSGLNVSTPSGSGPSGTQIHDSRFEEKFSQHGNGPNNLSFGTILSQHSETGTGIDFQGRQSSNPSGNAPAVTQSFIGGNQSHHSSGQQQSRSYGMYQSPNANSEYNPFGDNRTTNVGNYNQLPNAQYMVPPRYESYILESGDPNNYPQHGANRLQ